MFFANFHKINVFQTYPKEFCLSPIWEGQNEEESVKHRARKNVVFLTSSLNRCFTDLVDVGSIFGGSTNQNKK